MKAFVFVRPSSPQFFGQEFGHVGWGFQVSESEYIIGAVENTMGLPINLPSKMDFWSKKTLEPLKIFSTGPLGLNTKYDLYKEFSVLKPDVEKALKRMEWVSHQPYNVTNQNCMHSVFEILFDYGAINIPNPRHIENGAPVMWFQKIGVPYKVLMDSEEHLDVAIYEHPNMEGCVKRFIGNNSLKLNDLSEKKVGFSISSIVVKQGKIKAYDSLNFQGDTFEISVNKYMEYLNEWDNIILSMELLPETIKLANDLTSKKPQGGLIFDPKARQEIFNLSD